ncbi:hypothetical protein [Streptomyces sp. NBC_01614]|uniref:hypothetical protein n=1 Tax=Streptomyces sp. NBC_01614 TaxID=2975897 RepID=UPI00386C584A
MVVQQGRGASPPRPAPRPAQGNADNSLRNGYAAISHSVSGETAAIGLGFLAAGPVGAIVGGAALPVLVAASMWRARRREHDENANSGASGADRNDRSGSGRDRSCSGGGNGGGRHRSPNGPGGSGGGGRHKTPKGPGAGGGGLGGGKNRKPKVKDPVADKLGKLGKGLADKVKNRNPKSPKAKNDKPGKAGKDTTGADAKGPKGLTDPKGRKDHGGKYADDRPWLGRGHKDKPGKAKKDKRRKGDDTSSASARDGLDPKPPKAPKSPREKRDERIELVRAKRAKAARRAATRVGERAGADAARDGTAGDPHTVKLDRIRTENQWIDRELHREAQLLALAAGTEQRRSTPVTYPVATTQPASTRAAGVAVARQIDARASTAYQLLAAMAEQLANGLHGDADADMADHVVELVGIPAMCRNLSIAVRQAAAALQKTAPLHPSVIKHLNNAAVAALTAARMADTIIVVFVQAHREDIYRVMEPRVGEERWNIRNAAGTLDGAKLRAAIMASGQQRLALPAGRSPSGPTGGGSGKLVPASHGSTKKLIRLMAGFDRGHMVVVLSEVAGAAGGVEVVADSITKLYRRMAKSWPTEDVVDDTVRATASKVRTVAAELRKAIKAAQRAHQRELRLNARPRKGARAEKKWDVTKGRRG